MALLIENKCQSASDRISIMMPCFVIVAAGTLQTKAMAVVF